MEEILAALLQQELFIAAVLAAMLAMLITEKGITTSSRVTEYKARSDRYEKRAELAEKSLRENTDKLEYLTEVLADTNETLKLLIQQERRS